MLISWAQDNDYTNCTSCTIGFSLFTRKHHCRKCGKIFCKKCLNEYLENNQKINICNNCITIDNNTNNDILNDYNKIKNELKITKEILDKYLNKTQIITQTQSTQTSNTKEIITQTQSTQTSNIDQIITQTQSTQTPNTKEIITQTQSTQITNTEEIKNSINLCKSDSLDILECIKDVHNKEKLEKIQDESEYEIKKYEIAKEKRLQGTKDLVLEKKLEKKKKEEEEYMKNLHNIHNEYRKEVKKTVKFSF